MDDRTRNLIIIAAVAVVLLGILAWRWVPDLINPPPRTNLDVPQRGM